jgi:hypothetical protein
MSKAEMTVHNIKPDSLRFERSNLSLGKGDGGHQFTVVDLFCQSVHGHEFRLQMFMDDTPWNAPVTVDIGGIKIKGIDEEGCENGGTQSEDD